MRADAQEGGSAAAQRRARPGRWGITARLVLLVVVPVSGLAAMSGAIVVDRHQTAAKAAEVRVVVDRLTDLVAVRSDLRAERVAAEASLQARALGFPDETVLDLIGFDPRIELVARARDTDDAMTRLADAADFVDRRELGELRTAVQTSTIAADTAGHRFETQIARLQAEITGKLDELDRDTRGMSGGDDVVSSLSAIRALSDQTEAVYTEMVAFENLFLGRGDPFEAHEELIAARTTHQATQRQLDAVAFAPVADAWRTVRDSADAQTVSSVLAQIASGDPTSLAGNQSQILAVSKAALSHQDALRTATLRSLDAMGDASVSLEGQARTEQWRWVLATAALLAGILAVSVRTARSISKPVRRLAERAAAVSAGDLDVAPAAGSGPWELVAAASAFDDVVANLRLLEAKAQALSACEFDAPVLDTWLPGRLGESLQQSVQVLAGSIDERDQLQDHLAHQATHDGVTGLHNRAAAMIAIRDALARAQRRGSGLSVLVIDLDGFKLANDTYGHALGDEVLREAAARILRVHRSSDFLARLGGDEFLVLVEDVTDPVVATETAKRLIAATRGPVSVGDVQIPVTACVGIAFALDGTEDSDQLLAWADLAVDRAKARGREQIEIYDQTLQEELLQRAQTHDALAAGLGAGELFLVYQPVLRADGSMCGVEALVRWNRPGHGFQPPDTFIPAAEASNLIIDLDCWVLREAARQLVAWSALPGLCDIDMSINISGRHLLSGSLTTNVAQVLASTGVDPSSLVLEVTETVLIGDLATAANQLAEVRRLGVRIAIDDFGTGYTSVMQLQALPADIMKIDRAYVNQPKGTRSQPLLAMLIDLGHHLGLTVTAEGVETTEQLALLRELRCDHLQGYLFSKPVDPDRLEGWQPEPETVRP